MGHKIIMHTIRDLTRRHGLYAAQHVYLAGTSAGGIGVLMNVDMVQRYLDGQQSGAEVRGVVDSAWYMLPKEQKSEVRVTKSNVIFTSLKTH